MLLIALVIFLFEEKVRREKSSEVVILMMIDIKENIVDYVYFLCLVVRKKLKNYHPEMRERPLHLYLAKVVGRSKALTTILVKIVRQSQKQPSNQLLALPLILSCQQQYIFREHICHNFCSQP